MCFFFKLISCKANIIDVWGLPQSSINPLECGLSDSVMSSSDNIPGDGNDDIIPQWLRKHQHDYIYSLWSFFYTVN